MAIPSSVDRGIAQQIIKIGNELGANKNQILAALATAYVESGIRNLNYGDRDSLGIFQQRPSMGWGSPSQVTDPNYSIRKFYTELMKLNWTGSIGAMAQRVQRSAFPDRYNERGLPIAQQLFQQMGSGGPGGDQPIKAADPWLDLDDDPEDIDLEGLWTQVLQSMSDAIAESAGGRLPDDLPDTMMQSPADVAAFTEADVGMGESYKPNYSTELEKPGDSAVVELSNAFEERAAAAMEAARKQRAKLAASHAGHGHTHFEPGQHPSFEGKFANGRIPASALYKLRTQPGHMARADAGRAFDAMYRAALKDGVRLTLTDSYRDYATQVSLKARKPTLAATPGRSNHGWGVAFDISVGGFGSAQYNWLARNGARFGFVHPAWARANGSKPEPWHWEYTG